jgi:OFA family oxalate/formate antiporter-like MFS transporter
MSVLAASVLMMVCLGGVYAWSTFVTPLKSMYGLTTTQTQLIFGITFAVFTCITIPAGRLQDRYGPKLTAALSGLFLGLGYLVSSCSNGTFSLLFMGYGILGGMGIGFGYVCSISTCVKWFPEHKGLITGVVVAGYGSGAIVLSNAAAYLLGHGTDVLQIFRMVAIVYGAVIITCAMALVSPDKVSPDKAVKRIPVMSLMKQRPFQLLALGMFTGSFSGMMVAGNIKPIGLAGGLGAVVANLAISTFAVGNALGRVSWGWISDRVGKTAIPASLLFISLIMTTLIPAGSSSIAFVIISAVVAFGLGGCMVIYAAQVAAMYGTDAVASVYPIVMLFYGLAGITGPGVGGWLFDSTGSYTASILLASAVTAVGFIGALILQRKGRDSEQ